MGNASLLTPIPSKASRPNADALFRLGLKLSTGSPGEAPDKVTAHALFDLAARQGSIEAKVYRRELSEEMDLAEVVDARRIAQEWLAEK
jgi:TPR repeat protein